ncbi:hypothetical protein WMY93_010240 [Mugilogobius chulae]|uniref:RH1 domain-containing protein n=1 Tax=Mugilogobius chulae TaxID=88201 RepID=A0AAW0PI97_9GOBI
MPLVVAVLESLEAACGVSQEREVELELLKEDNEQLVTQYEREKALRKHAEEIEEREAELKKEYNALHQRHTEMIHSYMEHLERTKHQHGPAPEPSESAPTKTRKERPISIGLFHLPGADGVTPDPHRQPEDPAELWRFNNLSHPRSNTSLKDELSNFNRGSKSGSPSSQGSGPKAQPPSPAAHLRVQRPA